MQIFQSGMATLPASAIPIIVPSPAEIVACARCVPTGRSAVRGLGAIIALFAVAIAILVWFVDNTFRYIEFGLAIMIFIFGLVVAFAIKARCGPCLCG